MSIIYNGDEKDNKLAATSVFPYSELIEMYGFAGNDELVGAFLHPNLIFGGSGNDTINGGADINALHGEDGDDVLNAWIGNWSEHYGGAGNDSLTGGDYGNYLDGGAGTDTLTGGDGADTYLVDSTLDRIIESYTPYYDNDPNPADTVMSSVTWVLGANLENLSLLGSAAINGTGNALNNILAGNSGTNTLNGKGGQDTVDYSAATSALTVNLARTTLQFIGSDQGSDQLISIENVLGSNHSDLITGTAGANFLNGAAGNDTLAGGAGRDTLNGGQGEDTLDYRTATGTVIADLDAGSASNDGTGSVDTLIGMESIWSGSGNDRLVGNYANNRLEGRNGNDTLSGGAGVDTLVGGAGIDTLDYSSAYHLHINLALGTATNDGSGSSDVFSSIENVIGNAGENVMIGNSADNRLEGGRGSDTLAGGLGNDYLDGGDGDIEGNVYYSRDTVSYDGIGAAVNVSLALAVAQNTGGAGIDTLIDFEDLVGGAGNDRLAGNSASNYIFGQSGNDTLVGDAGNDTLAGGDGVDTADYSAFVAALSFDLATQRVENSVDYSLDFLYQIESINSGAGNDTIAGDTQNNRLSGGAGVDMIFGEDGNDWLLGGAGNDTLYGGAGQDTLTGDAGNDTLDGGTGADTMTGGDGNDIYIVDNASDRIIEALAGGTDRAHSSVSYSLQANVENLILTGSDAIDGTGNFLGNSITGNSAANVLGGGGGADKLIGGLGNDTLVGGTGKDVLTGGGGADTFKFVALNEGVDTLTDFMSGTDKIHVVAGNFGLSANVPVLLVSSASTPTPSGTEAQFLYNATAGALFFDQDGSGSAHAAIRIATLTGEKSLSAADIQVVIN